METNGNIEHRVATLEREVAELKQKLVGQTAGERRGSWVDQISGSMKEFPEWAEICRKGKEIGNAQGDDTDITDMAD